MKSFGRIMISAAAALFFIFSATSPSAQAASPHSGWSMLSKGSSKSLDSGSYYLGSDLNGDLEICGQVELCLNGHTITGSGKTSVITIKDGASLTLHDCGKGGCITGGEASQGGGISIGREASLVFQSGTIKGCSANRGGGIYSGPNSSLTITGGSLEDNSASLGGGLYIAGSASIEGLTVEGNSAAYNGAGILISAQEARVDIAQATVKYNSAVGHGAGIYAEGCQLSITGSTVSGNSAADTYACGGGIYVGQHAALSLTDTQIQSNSAAKDGGGICVSSEQSAHMSLSGGSVKNNSASNGGGIAATGLGELSLAGCDIRGNSASLNGGGVYIYMPESQEEEVKALSGCTVSGNSAVSYGGGLYIQGSGLDSVELQDMTIRSNTALDGGGVFLEEMEGLALKGTMEVLANTGTGRGQNLYLHGAKSLSVSELGAYSRIGLSIEYGTENVFTGDAQDRAQELRDCFESDIEDYGISVSSSGQLEVAMTFQVTLDTKGGTLAETSLFYTAGDPLGELPVPTKPGYTFTYWESSGRKVSPQDVVDYDRTLTANYDFNRYTLRFDPNGGSGTMAELSCRYTVPFNMPDCTFTKDGSVFAGWSLEKSGPVDYAAGARACSLCPDNGGSLTVYAQWTDEPATSLSLPGSLSLVPGEEQQLEPVLEPAGSDGAGLIWSSEDESVATVDQGMVTALEEGETLISAVLPNGESASCTVKVQRRELRAEDFTFSSQGQYDYNGQPQGPELESQPQGVEVSLRCLRREDGAEFTGLPSQPGSYDIYLDASQSQGFAAAQGLTRADWSFTIVQSRQEPLEIQGAPDTIHHGDSFTLSASGGSGDGELSWEISSGSCAAIDPASGYVTVTSMGDFTVTVTKAGSGGFDPVSAQASFTVERRQLYLESAPTVETEKVYDGTDQAVLLDMGQVSGFSQQDMGSIPVYAQARFADASAGIDKGIIVSYSLGDYEQYYIPPEDKYIPGGIIHPIVAQIAWNYSEAYEYMAAELSVSAYVANALPGDRVSCTGYVGASALDVGSYEAAVTGLDNGNYTLNGAEGNYLLWQILPRTVYVTAQDQSKSFGSEDPVLSYVCSDESGLVFTGSLSRDPGEEPGSYVISQGSLSLAQSGGTDPGNYVLEFSPGVLTIAQAQNQITGLYCPDTPYGSQPQPWCQADFGQVSYSFSQSPDGGFGPWDLNAAPGTWYVLAQAEGSYGYSSAQAICSFIYMREELAAVMSPEGLVISAYGDVSTQLSSQLPGHVYLTNTLGQISSRQAQVNWDLSSISYVDGQSLTVTGQAVLPEGMANSAFIPMTVTATVYVSGGTAQLAPQTTVTTPTLPSGSTAPDPFLG